MQAGQEVKYYLGGDETPRGATVAGIAGTGRSLAKRLDLVVRLDGHDEQVEDVPHEGDAEDGGHFWLLKGERRTKKEEGVPEDAPPPLEVPDGARVLPAVEKAAKKVR